MNMNSKVTCYFFSLLYYLYNGDELLGFIYNNNTYYYHKNLFGDIIGIYDFNYNEIITYKYNSWGVIKYITDNSNSNIGIINPFRYRSYYYDEEWMEDQDLGNYHYGYVGAATGYSKNFFVLAAGLNQLKSWGWGYS